MSTTRRRKANGTTKIPLARKVSTAADNWDHEHDPGVPLSKGASLLVDYSSALGMVLGGCCSNVLVYEQLLLMNSRIGSALTFSQMLFIALQSLPSFLSFTPFPRLKPRQAPLSRWALQVLVITTGSLLNNWAYAFKVPFTLLIVFRSAGLAVSMLMGYFVLKRTYTPLQIISVILVTVGVVVATLARPSSSNSSSFLDLEDLTKYATGISMLTVSLLLTGILGILQEKTYRLYGPCWKEGIFYTHALSLPVFLFLIPDIKQGFSSLSEPSSSSMTPWVAWTILGANLASQLACVSGVNKLSTQVSSVSTNLVLTARKALSLCLSVWWYRSGWNVQLGLGASMVFFGSLLFTSTSSESNKETKKE